MGIVIDSYLKKTAAAAGNRRGVSLFTSVYLFPGIGVYAQESRGFWNEKPGVFTATGSACVDPPKNPHMGDLRGERYDREA